jgi:hypothetical protein
MLANLGIGWAAANWRPCLKLNSCSCAPPVRNHRHQSFMESYSGTSRVASAGHTTCVMASLIHTAAVCRHAIPSGHMSATAMVDAVTHHALRTSYINMCRTRGSAQQVPYQGILLLLLLWLARDAAGNLSITLWQSYLRLRCHSDLWRQGESVVNQADQINAPVQQWVSHRAQHHHCRQRHMAQ